MEHVNSNGGSDGEEESPEGATGVLDDRIMLIEFYNFPIAGTPKADHQQGQQQQLHYNDASALLDLDNDELNYDEEEGEEDGEEGSVASPSPNGQPARNGSHVGGGEEEGEKVG